MPYMQKIHIDLFYFAVNLWSQRKSEKICTANFSIFAVFDTLLIGVCLAASNLEVSLKTELTLFSACNSLISLHGKNLEQMSHHAFRWGLLIDRKYNII